MSRPGAGEWRDGRAVESPGNVSGRGGYVAAARILLLALILTLGGAGKMNSAYGGEITGKETGGGAISVAMAETSSGDDREARESIGDEMEGTVGQIGIGEDLAHIQNFLDTQLSPDAGGGVSFLSLMKSLLTGDLESVLGQAGQGLRDGLVKEVHSGGSLLAQVVAIGMVGAVFTNFSSVFKGGHISDTGFFVTYLLLFTCLAASFFASLEIATGVLNQVLEFMKLLMPSYFMAVAFSGGSVSAVVLYEAMTAAVTMVQWLCCNLLLPVVRIYVLLVLAGHVAKEEMLTKLTELLEQGVGWALKTMVGLVLGFHVIQGMIVPYADSAGQAGVRKVIEIIPGLGQGAGAVAQIVLGSGVLIKNSLGAAAVVVLLIMSLVPIAKLAVLMLFYQLAAAVMQPVCDKRVVSCVSGVSCGHKLLLKIVISSLLLFAVAIAITCAATNVNYYTV